MFQPLIFVTYATGNPLSKPGLTCWDRRHRVNAMSLPKPRSWNLGAPRSKPRRGFSREKWVGKGTESPLKNPSGTQNLECKNVSFFANLCGCFCLICQLPIEIGTKWIGYHPCSWSKTVKNNRPDKFRYHYLSSTPRFKKNKKQHQISNCFIQGYDLSVHPCSHVILLLCLPPAPHLFTNQGFQDPKLIKKHGWSLRQGAIGLWHSLENQVWSRPKKWNTNSIC